MEPDRSARPDLRDVLRPLLDDLRATEGPGNDLVNMLALFIQQHVRDMSGSKVNITGLRVEVNGEAIEASLHLDPRWVLGPAAVPATVHLEPATLTLEPGTLTITPGPPPVSTRQDLILAALVVVYACLAYVCATTRPLPESLVEPLAGALGLLAWVYDRQ